MAELIQAITELFYAVIKAFGPGPTIGIFLFILVVTVLFRLYTDWRKDREINKVIAEKERTIQRLAQESREWRIAILREKYNWTPEEIEQFIHKNDFADANDSRKHLEGG